MAPASDPTTPNIDGAALPPVPGDGDFPQDVAETLRRAVIDARADHAEKAEAGCRAVLARDPEQIEALHLLGMLQYNRGAYIEAAETLERVTLLRPGFGPARLSRMVALARGGALDTAAAIAAELEDSRPEAAELHYVLGLVAERNGTLPEARLRFETATALAPSFVDAYVRLARLLLHVGEPQSASAVLDKVADTLPTEPGATDLPLRALCRNPVAAPQTVLDGHFAWGVRYSTPAAAELPQPTLTFDPDRPLRIGILVSGDAHAPFAGAALSIAGALHGSDIAPILYAAGPVTPPDGVPCVAIDGLSDSALVRRICADGIDVLLDTIGHEDGGRQSMLGYCPAPVQLAWGLPVGSRDIAFLLTDRTLVPEDMADQLPQRPWYLDGSVMQLPPLPALPDVDPKPAGSRNPNALFACFCDGSRMTSGVIDYWIDCMRRMPESRFALTNTTLTDGLIRQAVETAFKERGIDPHRLAMASTLSPQQLLAVMTNVDVMVGTLPLNDPMTAARALVMGVPAVTPAGDRPWARTTASLLKAMGLDELIGEDADDATAIAASLASDLTMLRGYRESLRGTALAFRDAQTERLGAAVSAAVRRIWRDGCVEVLATG